VPDSTASAAAVIFGVMQNTPCRVGRRLRGVAGAAALLLAGQAPIGLAAQAPGDSTRVDSTGAQRLEAVRVDVTRGPATAAGRLPWAVGTQTSEQVRRGQATIGIDEALANIPGVVVANRYNFALDQRLSIRGAGARANFGLRGVKVLLDGIPQSLPDGQSQLTNIDLGAVGRVEVLRGSASSLYGNGSGGVIAFTTDLSAPDALGASIRQTSGSFGLQKTHLRVSGRRGASIGAVSASRTTIDGFRQYSQADTRQLMAAWDRALGDALTMSLRTGAAETPHAQNPGALTAAEYAANPDSAAAANTNRGARRAVSQRYASVRLQRSGAGTEWSAAVYGQRRFGGDPLAAAPPAPAGATSGLYSTSDRRVLGARFDASRAAIGGTSLRLAAGLDAQRSYDVRKNRRSTNGTTDAPTDTLLIHQGETVVNLGPFVQAQFAPHDRVTASVGGRYDRLTFRSDDRFFGDGDDDSGQRTMSAASGHIGVVWRATATMSPYASIATAFETPTTTELQGRPDSAGGFNPDLGPQRVRTVEAGVRGAVGTRARYEIAVFEATARDAIVQFAEVGGRAYFRNAGSTRSRGAEVGLTLQPLGWLGLQAAWTWADYRFAEYRIVNGLSVDTLDGNRLAGVPRNAVRLGARARFGAATVDVDHSLMSALYADDRNTLRVEEWGAGQLNVRAAWSGQWGRWRAEPFVAVQNALDEAYVGSVTLNGFGGRVLEPAARRNWYLGLELSAPIFH
jgi:iron complex outermembrane receptor protein